MPKRKPPDQPGIPEWVLTYGDLMSLLLCFFILLAAFSEIKQPREYRRVIEAIKEALGSTGGIGLSRINEQTENSIISLLEEQAKRDDQRRSANQSPNQTIQGRNDLATTVHQSDRVAIGSALEFNPGSYELTAAMQRAIKFEIAPQIRGGRFIVHVTGHAWGEEDRAASGLSYAELSFRRAQSVIDYLVQECGVDAMILRNVAAGAQEPAGVSLDLGDSGVSNRRVQIYQTGQTLDQIHPDPNFSGRAD
ncbi:MAG: hypothetical protein D6695_04070 [Planctomycetota bacterium]|nr:MAG: hypothetical protein D6695_04070 [Planctomycetota bacterium]